MKTKEYKMFASDEFIEQLKINGHNDIDKYISADSLRHPITIIVEMPERKREFTEGELRDLLYARDAGYTHDRIADDAFKERE